MCMAPPAWCSMQRGEVGDHGVGGDEIGRLVENSPAA